MSKDVTAVDCRNCKNAGEIVGGGRVRCLSDPSDPVDIKWEIATGPLGCDEFVPSPNATIVVDPNGCGEIACCAPPAKTVLPHTSAERKAIPIASGVLDYFPAALIEVAKVSKAGNDKHNPGQPLHHARGKSSDHPDAMLRHFTERGTIDPETGVLASAEMVWRALAILQEECEQLWGYPLARGAKLPAVTP